MSFLNFEGKLVFVTGSTKGIGSKCNEVFYRAGADVIVAGRGAGDVAASAAALAAAVPARSGGGILHAAFDLGTPSGCDACLAWLEELGRPVDVLVNNLGIFEVRPFAEIADEEWTRFFEVNVMSGVRLCRALLPKMLARGSGSIVFVSSEAALATKPFMVHYSMTKTAQLSLARSLAGACKGVPGVRVNSVMPGPTHTEGIEAYIDKGFRKEGQTLAEAMSEYVRTVEPTSLLERLVEPEEVANLVVFLASNAHGIQGAALRSEGGILQSIV